jgi:peptide methionine sulfoxide reductase msrA/msrB
LFAKTTFSAFVKSKFGMSRIEIVSRSTGIHLGHVFEDGPNGNRRFCINATVLDFIADSKQ